MGDVAFAPDSLFSNGLVFGTIQLEQIGAMIARDREGQHSAEFIEELLGLIVKSETGQRGGFACGTTTATC